MRRKNPVKIVAIPAMTPAEVARFWRLVDVGGLEECWPNAYRARSRFWLRGKSYTSYRVAYALTHGAIPAGLFICHRCDNERCSNPCHLFAGSQLDNRRDAAAKGRTARGDRHSSKTHPESVPRGEGHYLAKLSAADVAQIRQLRAVRIPYKVIAELFGVSKSVACGAALGRSWRHV